MLPQLLWEGKMVELGNLLLGMGIFINALISVITFLLSLRQNKIIADLEKNTNSIKDALVKVTGEAEHAKGVLIGEAKGKLETLP